MKKIFLSAIVLTLIILVSSCNKSYDRTPIKVETDYYVIISLDPPKHVYIDLKRVSDGRNFTEVYVSKHLNNSEKVVIRDTILLKRYTYSDGSSDYTNFDNSEILKQLETKFNL